jgi:hypothetical protein
VDQMMFLVFLTWNHHTSGSQEPCTHSEDDMTLSTAEAGAKVGGATIWR